MEPVALLALVGLWGGCPLPRLRYDHGRWPTPDRRCPYTKRSRCHSDATRTPYAMRVEARRKKEKAAKEARRLARRSA